MSKSDYMGLGFFLGMVFTLGLCWLCKIDFSPTEPGTQAHTSSSQPGEPAQFILMDVSGYDAGECCCGKWTDGFTASGVPAVGRICAAPPEYPFGTVFDVEGMGEWVVQDRGGAIKGNKLDLLFPTHEEALEFGRKPLKVRIVE